MDQSTMGLIVSLLIWVAIVCLTLAISLFIEKQYLEEKKKEIDTIDIKIDRNYREFKRKYRERFPHHFNCNDFDQ